MRITKYGHACITLEQDDKRIIIDPGKLTKDIGDVSHVLGVVFTHKHFDHVSEDLLLKIMTANPDVCVFAPQDVADQVQHHSVKAVKQGDVIEIGPFKLEFFGGKHALIHGDLPDDQNVGVLVNGVFFHPGDSFDKPPHGVTVLGLPVSGPWLKTGDAIDYALAVQPQICIAIHDAINSEAGNKVTDNNIKAKCDAADIDYQHLQPGESIVI